MNSGQAKLVEREWQGLTLAKIVALVAIGSTSFLWQIASARSMMAGLYGNELSLGLLLSCWLTLMALGTLLGARFAPQEPAGQESLLGLLLFLTPLAIGASLVLQLRCMPGYTSFGAMPGPGQTVAITLSCLGPPCVLLGAAFGVISRRSFGERAIGPWAARLYLVESLGMVCAGCLFHFGLARAPLILTALVSAALCYFAALFVLHRRWTTMMHKGRWGVLTLVSTAGLTGLGVAAVAPAWSWLAPSITGYEILARENSPHAALMVLRRQGQLLFLVNGQVVFTNQEQAEAERTIHPVLLAHPQPRRMAMIGGGLGGGLAEVLKHPLQHLDYIELDSQLFDLARRFADQRSLAPWHDKRLNLLVGDGRQLIADRQQRYDVIFVGLSGPTSALMNRFYTEDFFHQARRALNPGGLLSVRLAGTEGYLSPTMAVTHATILAAMKHVFHQVVILPDQSTTLLAGRDGPPDTSFATLARRLEERRLTTIHFSPTELMALLLPFKEQLYLKRLEQVQPLPNTDLFPAAYFHHAMQWLALSAPALARGLSSLAPLLSRRVWLICLGAFLLTLLWTGMRRHRAAGLALGIAGMTGLALELCLILASQEIRGVVYHELGALLASFMLGLVLGAPLGSWLTRAMPRAALAIALGSAGLSGLVVCLSFELIRVFPSLALPVLLLALISVGSAVGSCYPAGAEMMSRHQIHHATARAYAWDLGGGAVGVLLAAALLLPLLGLVGTALLCCACCWGCGALIWRRGG